MNMALAVLICPDITELSEIKTNIKCTVQGCTSVFLNSSNLEMHLIKTHQKVSSYLDKKESDTVFHYFCPVDGCKYQLNTQRDVSELRWFSKMKFLKQHFLKVHKQREFTCSSCAKKFISEKEKNHHLENECGRKFTCSVCQFSYDSKVSLLTHARRKNHLIDLHQERPSKLMRLASSVGSPCKEIAILPKIMPDSSVNIAAAALSELSRKIIVKGVDKGVQTNSRRRSCHRTVKKNVLLQTQESQSRISAETQTITMYSNRKSNKKQDRSKCIETQTIEDTDNAVDSEDSIFSNLNSTKSPTDLITVSLPNFWQRNESATQTAVLNQTEDISLNLFMPSTNENFEPSKLCQNSNTYTEQFDRLIQQSTMLDDTRLCDIETQTELNDNSFVDDCPILSNNETQTIRISLDDIYSHNCTQTCDGLFDGFVEFADIETQTGWAADISADFVSAETQTIF